MYFLSGALAAFCSAEHNHLCYFGRGYQEEQFCDFFFEFGSMVQEMSFKRFLIWSSTEPPVQWSGTIYAILKEGIIGNIQSGGDVV